MSAFKKGEAVRFTPEGESNWAFGIAPEGLVSRVARDGTWVDVKWQDSYFGRWSKRMKPERLVKA